METWIQKWVELYKINFFQPKTNQDHNLWKEPIIITKEAYEEIKEDLKNNKRIEIDWELYNPYTIDTVKRYKIGEQINILLQKQPPEIQAKVKWYMKYEKRNTNIQRLESMIEKAKEELFIK